MTITSPFPRWLGKVAVTAVAYLVAGRLALLIAIPPGYATAVWPAAGIALVLVLLWGNAAWPGVLIGSFLVNVGTSFDAGSTTAVLKSVSIAASIGAGASLQSVFGAFLVQRFVGSPSPLQENRDILLFFVLGGLVGSLVSATCGVSTLVVAGLIPSGNGGFSWLTWWIGDAIGVMVFAPVVMSFVSEPGSAWRSRRFTVAAPLLVGFALVTVFFVRSSAWENERINADFSRRAAVMAHTLERQLDRYVEAVESLAGLFRMAPAVTRDEFRTLTQAPLQRHLDSLALSWVPAVSGSERELYEERARRDGFTDLEVEEKTPSGTLVSAPIRDQYFPVYYREPPTGDEAPLGFDIGADRPQREALERARDTGVTTATPPLRSGQEGAGQVTVLLLAPVYQENLPPKTVEERRASLNGFATGILRVGSVVKGALQGFDHDGMNVRLVDDSAPDGEALLHDDLPAPAGRSDASLQGGFSAAFDIAGRHWRFSVLPTPEYFAGRRSLQPWSVLTGGLFFVALLGTLLLSISGREARAEAKYLDLYVDAPDMYCSLSAVDWSVIDCNETLVAGIGVARDEIIGRPVLDFYDPDCLEAARIALRYFVTTGSVRDAELQLRHRDGRKVDVSLNVTAIRDARGKVVRGLSVWRDITARKRTDRDRQLLLRLGEDLRVVADPFELLYRVATELGEHLDVSRCHFSEADLVRERMIIHGDHHRGLPSVAGNYPLSMFSTVTIDEMKAGRTVINVDASSDVHTAKYFETAYRRHGLGAYVAVPLLRDGQWRGTLWVSVEKPRAWTDREVALVQTVAERTWLWMEHLRMVQALRESEDLYRDLSQGLEQRVEERTSQLTRASEQIGATLREKEVLLKEVYHRVKNNLQVVSSLLDLQSRHLGGKSSKAVLQDCANRVKSMALVHEKLYQSRDLSRLDFGGYVRQLAEEIFRSYVATDGRLCVALAVDVCEMSIDLETLIPCGLVVNELVSNALKHGFPDGRKGEVRVRISQEDGGQIRLVVSDDGIGLPAGVETESPSTLGLKLVDMLSRQLGGILSLERSAGTTVCMIFPAPAARAGHS